MDVTFEKREVVAKMPPNRHICPDCKGTGQKVAGLFCDAPGHIACGFAVCRRCDGIGHLRGKARE